MALSNTLGTGPAPPMASSNAQGAGAGAGAGPSGSGAAGLANGGHHHRQLHQPAAWNRVQPALLSAWQNGAAQAWWRAHSFTREGAAGFEVACLHCPIPLGVLMMHMLQSILPYACLRAQARHLTVFLHCRPCLWALAAASDNPCCVRACISG